MNTKIGLLIEQNPELITSFLHQHTLLLAKILETGMLWWVSSVVFCGAIIGTSWIFRKQVLQIRHLNIYLFLVEAFFISTVLYGLWVIYTISQIKKQISAILSSLKIDPESAIVKLYNVEFDGMLVAYLIGTTSFMIVSLLWPLFWKNICCLQKKLEKKIQAFQP